MKLNKIITAVAAVVFAGNVAAQATSGSSLNESGGAYLGALPVGIVANTAFRDALQAAQLNALCVGNDSKTCMPSISTVELATILQGSFGAEWGDYGISAFGSGALASAAVCDTIAGDEATRVAARHVGIGCSTANPEGLFNGIATALGIPQGDTATCLGAVAGASAGAIGFATADTAGYSFIKLDGEAPDLANFAAGNYAMFADVHGGSLTGAVTAQPFGTTGAIAAASNPPMHVSAGNINLSNECAAGALRSSASGNLTD